MKGKAGKEGKDYTRETGIDIESRSNRNGKFKVRDRGNPGNPEVVHVVVLMM